MLKETKQLFKYIIEHPANTWTVEGSSWCLSIQAKDAQIKIVLKGDKNYEVYRTHGQYTMFCDKTSDPPDYRSNNFAEYRYKKDNELTKQLVVQAQSSNMKLYKGDVDYITCAGKRIQVPRASGKVQLDITNRIE